MSYFKINNKYDVLLPDSPRIQTPHSISWQIFKLMLHIIIHSQQSMITEKLQIKNKCLAHNNHQGHHAYSQIQMLKLKVLHMFFITFQVCSAAALSHKLQYNLSIYWIQHEKIFVLSICAALLCLVLLPYSSVIWVELADRFVFLIPQEAMS